jgi:hypothetical protein
MREWMYSFTILILKTRWGEWLASHLCRFIPEETAHGTHCIGGWVNPRAGLDFMEKGEKSLPLPESNPDTSAIQPLA